MLTSAVYCSKACGRESSLTVFCLLETFPTSGGEPSLGTRIIDEVIFAEVAKTCHIATCTNFGEKDAHDHFPACPLLLLQYAVDMSDFGPETGLGQEKFADRQIK